MKVAVLTSSRAEFGIYLALLDKMKIDTYFEFEIIAFGTHLSHFYGNTIDEINKNGFEVSHTVESLSLDDSPAAISNSIGLTTIKFSSFWKEHSYDLILAFGDRIEMYAACLASLPFNIPIAHLHGGETTEGAIDNVFRHSLSLMSKYHFVSTDTYANRVVEIIGTMEGVFNTGALSIDNLKKAELYSINQMKTEFDLDLSIPSILITVHPETIGYKQNQHHIEEIYSAFTEIDDYQLVITMPNSDTSGNVIRNYWDKLQESKNNVFTIESFGMKGYLSCMKHCSFMLGNTSSGFVEASFFPKYVINLGNRQKGRIITSNIRNTEISKYEILKAIDDYSNFDDSQKVNIYGDGNAARNILQHLKDIY